MGASGGIGSVGGRHGTAAIEPYDTQYPDVGNGAAKRQVVMGLDFGTAFTKVVIADNRRAYAAAFHDSGTGVSRYLQRSEVNIAHDGLASLDVRAGSSRFSDLKLRILNNDTADDVIRASVAFIALVIRAARRQFLTAHCDEFGNDRLDWQLNIGLPADRCGNDRLTTFYRSLASAAWRVSATVGPVTAQAAEDSFLRGDGALSGDAVEIVPEFAAQVCGYVRSPMRQNGAHLLIDVGGGTLDAAVFNVYRDVDESDLFPVFAGSVTASGVLPMHQRRLASLDADSVPVRTHDYVETSSYADAAEHLSVSVESLKRADAPFRDEVRSQILGVLETAKRERYPRLYQQPVRVFLCGGGARVELFSRIVESLVRAHYPCNLEFAKLPRVDRLAAEHLDDDVYDRLSVAYGLSFDAFDIGTVRLPHELDAGRPTAGRERRVCPMCNGTGGPRGNDCIGCSGSGWLS